MFTKLIAAILPLLLLAACFAAGTPAGSDMGITAPAAKTAPIATVAQANPTIVVQPPATVPPPAVPSPVPSVTAEAFIPMETTFFSPDDERFHYIGRFDFDNADGPAFDWSGSAVEFSFVGTGLAIQLADGRNSYNVAIDDRREVLKTTIDSGVYVLAEELDPGEHTVRISKRTEAYVGAAVFKGTDITGDLLEKRSTADRRIEFIGDSITAGYGNEGDSPDCWFTPDTENADLSYAVVTADALDADYSLIALSGLGVVRNLRDDTAVSEQTAVDFIDRTLGLNPFIIWPPERNTPDAVVINLGTNDYSSAPIPADEEFVAAYVELLQSIRDRYPDAFIFAIAGPLMLYPAPRVIASAVAQFEAANHDQRVMVLEIEDNLQRSAEDFGCDWHPNISGHQKIAAQLIPAVAETLGW